MAVDAGTQAQALATANLSNQIATATAQPAANWVNPDANVSGSGNFRSLNLRSPREASKVFGFDRAAAITGPIPDGLAQPRPKFLFFVRFVRAGAVGQTNDPVWARGMSFAVKSVDRPTIQAETQELNQYNKKRQIYTSIKYQPVNINFFDTVDTNLFRMWSEYSQWYFGDFRHGENEADWAYDITTTEFSDKAQQGYGFAPFVNYSGDITAANPNDLTRPYFFSKVEIYQFFGNTYTQIDLVNPKITSFAPDELDYEVSQSSSIRVGFAYESVIYHNASLPTPISTSDVLTTLFGEQFNGGTFDPSGTAQVLPASFNTTTNSPGVPPSRLQTPDENSLGILTSFDSELSQQQQQSVTQQTTQIFTPQLQTQQAILAAANQAAQTTLINQPALGSFGSFNFGTPAATITNLVVSDVSTGNFSNFGGALLGAAGQPVLSQAVSGNNFGRDFVSGTLSSLPGANIAGISGQAFDSASGAVGIGTSPFSGIKSPSITAAAGQGIVGSLLAASTSGTPVGQVRTGSGLSVNSAQLGAINANRPAQAQYGFLSP